MHYFASVAEWLIFHILLELSEPFAGIQDFSISQANEAYVNILSLSVKAEGSLSFETVGQVHQDDRNN